MPEKQQQNSWELVHSFNTAHTTYVTCLAVNNQYLYSTSHKLLKIWDLAKFQIINEIPVSNYLIKGLTLCPDRNIIAVTSDKNISLFDMKNYDQVGQLKGHKD